MRDLECNVDNYDKNTLTLLKEAAGGANKLNWNSYCVFEKIVLKETPHYDRTEFTDDKGQKCKRPEVY